MLRLSKEKFNKYLMLKGVNKTTLAKEAGITLSTISRALNDKHNTSPETIGKIAKALGITPADILEEVDE